MTWQQASHETACTAKDFLFADGRRTDLRLAYRTLGELAPDKGNAILLLHGMVGSGLQFLQPTFANALFDAGEPLDARAHFIIPDVEECSFLGYQRVSPPVADSPRTRRQRSPEAECCKRPVQAACGVALCLQQHGAPRHERGPH